MEGLEWGAGEVRVERASPLLGRADEGIRRGWLRARRAAEERTEYFRTVRILKNLDQGREPAPDALATRGTRQAEAKVADGQLFQFLRERRPLFRSRAEVVGE